MYDEIFSPCKINLSLRVTSKRNDGLHDLVSLFFKLVGIERLTISDVATDNVKDNIIVHNFNLDGENIIVKVLALCRDSGLQIPPLKVEIFKEISPGSGLGAGSGNAAEFLKWLESMYGTIPMPDIYGRLGADVPFLRSDADLALATGIGGVLQLRKIRSGLAYAVFIPEWMSSTADAYKKLDNWYRDKGFPLSETEAIDEAESIISCLNAGERWGMLPNDFSPFLMYEWPEYSDLFEILRDNTDAIAWGITGSGSAAFAVFDIDATKDLMPLFSSLEWLRKIFFWGDDR